VASSHAVPAEGIPFTKGHGTGNDFVVLLDPDNTLDLTASRAAALCHRRMGIGADGVLRAVKVARMPSSTGSSTTSLSSAESQAEWFMDYRNADGSTAEMCGNGARVFARFLHERGLLSGGAVPVLTRGGVVTVEVAQDNNGKVVVDMGVPRHDVKATPKISVDGRSWNGTAVHIPNPHCVVWTESLDDAGTLLSAPEVSPPEVYPDGVNVEFVVEVTPAHIAMRVHERGSGETLSCGTGACAAAYAHALRSGDADQEWVRRVDVPGGTVSVRRTGEGHLLLEGPAVFVAHGVIPQSWWEAHP
jgi:diaminopimelate epimerase